MKQCSKLFSEVFDSHCGGIVRTCSCGIITFNCIDRGFYDEGELDALLKKQKVNPELYRAVDYTVTTMTFSGIEIVNGCSCDTARKAEEFIRINARLLAVYLRGYADELRKQAANIDV